jgi:hypothetical protein
MRRVENQAGLWVLELFVFFLCDLRHRRLRIPEINPAGARASILVWILTPALAGDCHYYFL